MIGDRSYPLDKWVRDTFMEEFKKAGGRYQPIGSPRERHAMKILDWEDILANTPRYMLAREEAKERLLYGSKQRKAKAKAATEEAASKRYLAAPEKPSDSDGENH